MTTNRRLAAILAADVAGYSRLMAADEVPTLAALKTARREVVDPAIAEHKGRIVKTTGDGFGQGSQDPLLTELRPRHSASNQGDLN